MASAPDRDHLGRKLDTLIHCALNRRTLKLSCRNCPHVGLLDAVPVFFLFERKGWSGLMWDVPKRFYCSRCLTERLRKVRAPRVQVTTEQPGKSQFPYPDERTWKKLLSRYRS